MCNGDSFAKRFVSELFALLRAVDGEQLNGFLSDPDCKRTKRTNLFLGRTGRIGDFEGKKGNDTCLLALLHTRLYSDITETSPPLLSAEFEEITNESLVWFETMGYDCIFLPHRRKRLKNGPKYPIAWTYDWVIEVENEFDEFAFTLQCLLDINCNKRMAIFFNDIVDEKAADFLRDITLRFKPAWEYYKATQYRNVSLDEAATLYSLIFPDTFKGIEDYLARAKLVRWHKGGQFIEVR